jgi:hypothetical protein
MKGSFMKTSVVIKRLLVGACIYYSVFSLLLLTINVIINGQVAGSVLSVPNILMLFPFAFSLSGAEFIRKSDKLSGGVRVLLHYLILAAAFLLFLWAPSNAQKTIQSALLLLFLESIVYWIVYAVCHLTVKRFHSFKEE